MKAIAAAVLATGGLLGCVAPPQYVPPPVWLIKSDFNAEQAAAAMRPGPNTIRGSAFMRQGGGGVVTCAGRTVSLIPATRYADDRFAGIYTFNADRAAARFRSIRFDPYESGYDKFMVETRCDAQGSFKFEQVADGTFYVETSVSWVVAREEQGGRLVHRVTVNGGVVRDLILSP